jgi:hypothetical protein
VHFCSVSRKNNGFLNFPNSTPSWINLIFTRERTQYPFSFRFWKRFYVVVGFKLFLNYWFRF